nr:hypothetical protein [uncultured bacterium]
MSFFTGYHLCNETSASELSLAINLLDETGANSLLILACDQDGWTKEQVDPILLQCPMRVFGGIFPAVVFNNQLLDRGTLVIGLRDSFDAQIIENISDDPAKFSSLISQNLTGFARANSMLVIVDGLAKNIEALVEELFIHLGSSVNAMGGGAGSLDFIQKPIIFSNRGLLQDAAVIAATTAQSSVGVQHGWEILDGPYLVTESEANCLSAINFQPAFDIYKNSVEKHTELRFDQEDFFTIAKTYPLGIVSVDGELLVRDPLKVVDKALICVGEVPQNSTFYLLKGLSDNLIRASGEAAMKSKQNRQDQPSSQSHSVLLFDCISRQLFLEDKYHLALESVKNNLDSSAVLLGALTLGEIANSSHGPIELLNKTTVVAHFD